MKTLKFKPHLVEQILAGTKTATWRLFDDKNLTIGDVVDFLDKETGDRFGSAVLTDIRTKTLGTLIDSDWIGHERFESEDAMYREYRSYYGDSVGPETEIKLISFVFTKE